MLHESLPTVSYVGIYDGHGGRQIVDFLEPNLERVVAEVHDLHHMYFS